MERATTLLLHGLLAVSISAQSGPRTGQVAEHMNTLREAGVDFQQIPLFGEMPRSTATDALWQDAVSQARVVRLDRSVTAMLLGARSAYISVELPSDEGALVLDLERVEITTEDFQVTEASTGTAADVPVGLHYRGMIRGVEGSLAAISVFPDEVMGLMSDAEGERVLGRFADDTDGDHIFYRERDLLGISGSVCGTADVDMSDPIDHTGEVAADRTVKCVRFYWEVNHDIFQGKGSVTNAVNYVTGLFNQTAVLYANDGISVALSEVYVWDVPSPYTSTSTSTQLSTFGTTRTSFNGDLAHLLGYTGGGGVAWVNTICNGQTRYRMAYSDINSTFSNVPTYSWSVEVVTHEQGHNMGSSHTHACVWNGNNTAIDGCGPAAGYSEGSCAAGPVPSSSTGGTIMSYCHLTGTGINFANGFGPQPAALIISRINNASCLTTCGAQTCSAPTNLLAGSLTTSSASLSWTGAAGALSYTLQWKQASASTWTTVTGITGTTYNLSGLVAGTGYQFKVLSICSGSSSGDSSTASFTTTSIACNVPSGLSSASITTTSAALSWGAVSGAVSYTLQWKTTAGTTWTTITGVTTTTRTLTGLISGTAYQFKVLTVCATGSSAYSNIASFTTASPVCNVPAGLASGSITTTSAALSWGAVSGAVSYTLQWKTTAGTTWTTITGVTTTTRTLTGLISGTAYQFKVLTVCATGSSAYSNIASFTTMQVPSCSDVYEPNNGRSSSSSISVNSSTTARIGVSGDVDWFRFANTSGSSNIRVTLVDLPANYRIDLYRNGTLLATSNASGTNNEQIVLNTTTVSSSYHVRVRGVGGVFNAALCYTLNIQTSATAFMPAGLPGTPDGGGADDDGVERARIYPNPANDVVYIGLSPSEGPTEVELFDGSGRSSGKFTYPAGSASERMVLNVADRPSGIYLVRVSQGGKDTVHRLVIGH